MAGYFSATSMNFDFDSASRSFPTFTSGMSHGVFEIKGAYYLDDTSMNVDSSNAKQTSFVPNLQNQQTPVSSYMPPTSISFSTTPSVFSTTPNFSATTPGSTFFTPNTFSNQAFSATHNNLFTTTPTLPRPSLFSVPTTSDFSFVKSDVPASSLFGTSSCFSFSSTPTFTFNHTTISGQNTTSLVDLLDTTHGINKLNPADLSIQEAVGQGHFGEVFKGVLKNGAHVAVKRIVRHTFRNRNEWTLLAQEIQIQSQLHHPNIISLVGVTKLGDDYCMVTEFLPGGTLRNFIDKLPHLLTPVKRHLLARGVAAGMEYLHNWKPTPIIHRDLTSSNIMLDANANPKIGDFGLSRTKPDNNSTSTMSAAVGALAWMAPEVYKGDPYNEKADVYSFSIVCWELWTMRDPHCGSPPDVIASMAALRDMRPPVDESVPERWKVLIMASWAPSPRDRPSFTQIIKYLDQLQV